MKIPKVGIGTWQESKYQKNIVTKQTGSEGQSIYLHKNPDGLVEDLQQALEIGYRHIDTAQIYGLEDFVGVAIDNSSVDRDKLFVSTKVWSTNLGYKEVISSTRTSLSRLGLEYIDLLYIHKPSSSYDPYETLRAFDELYQDGVVRNVGVSNFTPELVIEAKNYLTAPLVANQIEVHPLLPQEEMVSFAETENVTIVAYSPLARGKVSEITQIEEVAKRHGISEAQVTLAWHIERGTKPIPSSSSAEHIRENLSSTSISLDGEDMRKINSISERDRIIDTDRDQ
ncbi:aldo/keto reductase [Haladaptatus sp. F3-133]|jgi:2,5-diketo-D-gluconate reductase B|uniref:Aldo/keto reductase n=1 Tax=Halorutilus salinus TaxID=2487751 RepID=A0A9Q4GGQ5_9EURY|nr:aldo/keto reductase [Halorutilus salinus]MCX2819394.1 aldo/keto reductase [Halorutilus salinus]